MSHPPKPTFFFKGFPEDVRFRSHTVPESLKIAQGTLYEAWFKALQLSPYYTQGVDTGLWPSDLARDTFRTFGDLRNTQFAQWWIEKGYRLFAEQHAFPQIVLADSTDDLGNINAVITLIIPLNLSPPTLKRQFDTLLREHHPYYKDFDRWKASSAQVRLENRKLTSVSINLYLKVYEAWINKSTLNKNVHLFEIGDELKLSPKDSALQSDPPRIASSQHLRMSLLVSEYLEKAKNLVAHATEGRFPCTEDHHWIERRRRNGNPTVG
jgi:hypothetical protein